MLQAHGASRRHGYAWRFVRIGTLSGDATDAAGACYARRAGKAGCSLSGAVSPRSASRLTRTSGAWAACISAATRSSTARTAKRGKTLSPSLWTAAIVLGVCQQPKLPRAAAITTSTELPSRSRMRPGCSNRAAMSLGVDLRVWLLIRLKEGAARLRLAFRLHRHLVGRCYGYRWGLLREASGKNGF